MSSLRPSNRAIGHNYYDALIELRRRSEETGDIGLNGKRLSRKWIVAKLGCSAGLLSSNHKIKGYLRTWERQLAKTIPAPLVIAKVELPSNVVELPSRTGIHSPIHDKIMWGKVDVSGTNILLPTVFDGARISSHESDWCRHLVLDRDYTKGSVEGSLVILRSFRRFIRKLGVRLQDVVDGTFVSWKFHMRANGLESKRINTCLVTVHHYFQWLEKSRILQYRVQIYEPSELPIEVARTHIFPISSKRLIKKTKIGEITIGWTATVHARGTGGLSTGRNTPVNAHVKQANGNAKGQKHEVRNRIILSVAEEAGPRVTEILEIKVSQLPTGAQLEDIIERNGEWTVYVRRKNRSKLMPIILNAYLLMRIFKYIHTERAAVVQRYPDKAPYNDHLFLSDRGTELKADSVTHIVIELFDGVLEKAGIHRLRSKFSVDELEKLLNGALETGIDVGPTSNWVETFLTMVADRMGQASVTSLRPYLPIVFGKRLVKTKTAISRDLQVQIDGQHKLLEEQQMRITEIDRQLDAAVVKLQSYGKLLRIAEGLPPQHMEQLIEYGNKISGEARKRR